MTQIVPRRTFLSLIAVSAAALATACSDSGGQAQAETSPEPSAPSPTTTSSTSVSAPASQGSVNMSKLLEPGPLPEMVLGNADAPVTIVEYASMTCPHCAHFHETTLPELKTKYIDTGKARLIFREFPFDPRAEAGFMLARCSGDNYFAMIDVLFRQQGNWAGVQNAQEALLQISKLAGFSQESFEACLTDQKLLDDVRAVRKLGEGFKVDSTPTFFINGNTYKGALKIEEMSAIIDGML